MEEDILDASDLISQLPDFIIHHMLSFLDSYADLVKVSVLSRRWFALWATFPNLDFNFSKMLKILEEIDCKKTGLPIDDRRLDLEISSTEKLIKYAAYTLSRFSEYNVSAHSFKLHIGVEEPKEATYIDKWISFVVEKNVQVLDICVWTTDGVNKYHLPNTILSATSLTSLTLCDCELPSSLLVDGVKFKSLKSLCLKTLQIDEKVIKYLTTMCPLLEEFNVCGCTGYKVFCVSGLQNLQKVWIIPTGEVEMIDIEAQNLTYLSISNALGTRAPHINVFSCKNLKTLYLGSFKLRTSWFGQFISSFPVLENVHLGDCSLEKKFKISSRSLRKFELGYCDNVKEIGIDASNLLLFRYVGLPKRPLFSLTSGFAKWEAVIDFDLEEDEDIIWFHKLRRFLYKANQFKVLKLYVHIDVDSINVDELKMTPPFELEHLELKISPLAPTFPGVVDAVFWCCRPQSLTLVDSDLFHYDGGDNLVKYVYEKLLHQNSQPQKEIEIMVAGGAKADNFFADFNLLLDALPGLQPGQEITFKVKRDHKARKIGRCVQAVSNC